MGLTRHRNSCIGIAAPKCIFGLWAYLWVNWYCPKEWALWARSANEKEIPILKTTMMADSQWRTIKHDYLHRFSCPRVDLIVWVLLSRLIPESCNMRLSCQACQPETPHDHVIPTLYTVMSSRHSPRSHHPDTPHSLYTIVRQSAIHRILMFNPGKRTSHQYI